MSMFGRSVVITGYGRTPFGSFLGGLSHLTAPQLGSIAMTSAIKSSRIEPGEVEQVIMGHVLQAGCGQAPSRQAAIGAGIPERVDAWSLNKVCSSGMKSVSLGVQSIAAGECEVVLAGGMESMSQAPYYVKKARQGGYRYGHGELTDGLLGDGLWDPYNDMHMGHCCESTMSELGISRAMCDGYATESYRRAAEAWKSGAMAAEVTKVDCGKVKGVSEFVERDEDVNKFKVDKVSSLRLSFPSESGTPPTGTITAANASNLNDGAAAIVLMSLEKARSLNITPLAQVVSTADAALRPIDFSIAPVQAAKTALKRAKLETVDFYEINEAFSGVVLANMKLLGLDHSRVNLHGGAVAIGHPLGASGCRIIMSLINVMHRNNGRTGMASICNGGGGASSIVLSTLPEAMSSL